MKFYTYQNKKIPKLGFGTWMLQKEQAVRAVGHALEVGYRHIDTADVYNNEEDVGLALSKSPVSREDIFLTTKIWRDDLSPEKMKKQIKLSLDKLQTSYVDLLLIHWPNSQFPLEDSLKTLEEMVQKNQTQWIGVSNFPVALLSKAKKLCPSLRTNQVEYHPFLSQTKILKYVVDNQMFLTAYSPLARGKILKSQQIEYVAQKYKKTPSQVVLRWLVEQEAVVPIVKSKTEKHIKENFDIFNFQLEKEDQEKLYRLTHQNQRIVNPPFAPQWD